MADGDQITAEEYASWVPAPEAIKRVARAMNDWSVAADTLLTRLDAGLLRAHIKTGTVESNGKVDKLKAFVVVPTKITKVWADSDSPSGWRFWTSGDAEITLSGRGDYGYSIQIVWRLFGIRFDPAGVAELAPTLPSAPPTPPPVPTPDKIPVMAMGAPTAAPLPPARPRAGRPRKAFWDDLLIATIKAMWEGDLKPETYADVERWMLDWASENTDEGVSETAVKEPAKKIFNAFKE